MNANFILEQYNTNKKGARLNRPTPFISFNYKCHVNRKMSQHKSTYY